MRGEFDRDGAVQAAQQAHRNYAKRQMTWFRREPDVIWISASEMTQSPERGDRKDRRVQSLRLRESRLSFFANLRNPFASFAVRSF